MAYSLVPLGVLVAITLRCLVKAPSACSALLLFHGTLSWSRKVKSLPSFFNKLNSRVIGKCRLSQFVKKCAHIAFVLAQIAFLQAALIYGLNNGPEQFGESCRNPA